jgi:hypothetical protein
LAELHAYWAGRAASGHGVPRRADIDPLDLPAGLWPQLFIYQRTAENRLRCRLCGSAIVEIQGRDVTGLHIDELMRAEAIPLRQGIMLRVLDERRPVYYAGPLAVHDREHRWTYRLMLPVAAEGDDPQRPSQLFGGVYYGPAQDTDDWRPELAQVIWGDPVA